VGARAKTLTPAVLAALIMTFATTGPAAAQDSLESTTPGTSVEIDGPMSLGGMTPIPLGDLPPGHYLLRASAPGSVAGLGRMVRDSGGNLSVGSVGGPGGLFYPPGFVHFRLGESSRGFLFLGAGAAGLTGVALQQFQVDDAQQESDRARSSYDAAVSASEFDRARLDLLAANDRQADERDLRTMWGFYLGAAWVGAAVENWFLTPHPKLLRGNDGVYRLDIPPAGRASAAMRSLLVPGAGQRSLGHNGRGNRFTAAVMLFGAGSIVAQDYFLESRREQNDAQRRYEIAETESEIKRWRTELEDAAGRTTDRSRIRWALVGATVGVYLWNVFDAGTLGSEAVAPAPMSWQIVPGPDGFMAGLTWRIS
jgi:hypothetical protein